MKKSLFILPIERKVIFPNQLITLTIDGDAGYNNKEHGEYIGLVTIVDEKNNKHPSYQEIKKIDDLSQYGVLIKITSMQSVQSFTTVQNKERITSFGVRLQGVAVARLKVESFTKKKPNLFANVNILLDEIDAKLEKQILQGEQITQLKELVRIYDEFIRGSMRANLQQQTFDGFQTVNKMLFRMIAFLKIDYLEKLEILQVNDLQERIDLIKKFCELLIASEQEKKEREGDENNKPQNQTITFKLPDTLQQQIMKKVQNGKQDNNDASNLRKKFENKKLPDNVKQIVEQELQKLENSQAHSSEKAVMINYIETILSLPWLESSQDISNLQQAQETLDRDHSGLEKVKKRILEFLAIKQLNGNSKGSIICLSGPPGVGKTSLGKSIAECLGRKFHRISLGGVSDESEIRGHRRTYVGAMPGVFIQTLKKCQTNNPVILLDEIDKVSRHRTGDPSSALLEVLDPNQNSTFTDHFLGIPFDLSNVLFIATANDLENMQSALLDRLEVINIPGYTKMEKIEIANKYLIPKQLKENGLSEGQIQISVDAVENVIVGYTREPGVRELERNIGSICRHYAVEYLKQIQADSNKKSSFDIKKINTDEVEKVLGPLKFEEDIRDRINEPGIAVGMAWTGAGGKILYIEASKSKGQGKVQLTGQLGDVMKESVHTAIAWIRTHISQLGIDQQMFTNTNGKLVYHVIDDISKLMDSLDLFVHFPAASVPKDGPSAGITITTALVSLLTNRRVKQKIAMSGEITLKGLVMPVGGIKEKCIGAYAAGINHIILSSKNKKDVLEITKEIKDQIKFTFVDKIEQVLQIALESDYDDVSHQVLLPKL